MNFDWLNDWAFWAWAVPVVLTIGFGGFEIGVWWSARGRASVVAEREDREYRKRNSAVLKITQLGFDDFGRFFIGIRNEGDHRAESVQVSTDLGKLSIDEGFSLEPQDGFSAMVTFGLERPAKGPRYTSEDLAHLPRESLLQVAYSDGVGLHRRRWKLILEPRGEYFHEWHKAAEPTENGPPW